jgi:two-component system, cell cycle sensor histidine kinase and response regulator CckA
MQLPLPENEVARLENLRSYGILDTPPEHAFDDLTRLAAYICGTPIALIGLMDLDRQWFKSRIGWDVPEVPRDMSFCAHTILQADVLVVSDTLEDAQGLATCPLATHGGVRFYAGAPLISAEGHALGTLCVMDSVPRGLTEGQIDGLRNLARQVMTQLESRRRSMSQTFSLAGSGKMSESKGAEGISLESEVLYRRVTETASDAIIVIDEHSEILFVNRATERIFGYLKDELLGQQLTMLMPDYLRQIHEQAIKKYVETGNRHLSWDGVELPGLHKSGKEISLEISFGEFVRDGKRIFTGTCRDTTQRKRFEDERFQLAAIVESSEDAIIGKDLDGIITSWNKGAEHIYGYAAEEVLGKPISILAPADRRDEILQILEKVKCGEHIKHSETARVTKSGGRIHISLTASPIRDDAGRIVGVSAVERDITERKQAEEALRTSEERYRSLFESVVHGIYRVSVDGQIFEVNPALAAMLGYDSPVEVVKLNTADIYADREERSRLVQKWLKKERIEDEVNWNRRNGEIIRVRLSGRTLTDQHGAVQGFEFITEDVTERRALEEQLRQAQKIEAVGQLAGGVAHEFNNFLGVILGYSELLADEAGENEGLRRKVAEIKAATQRAASLTRQLLAFSRKQILEPKVLDLNQAIWETHKLLRRLVPANIDVVPVLAPTIGQVKVDPGQVQQILINLVVNARDAMPEGGKVVIETANADLDEEDASQHVGLRPGSYVLLSVSDTGCGMDAETRSHTFEPFFTTKQPGKGTGLGLSTIYGIIKQSGGHITVESVVGKGTIFRIYLPVVEAAVEEADVIPAPPVEPGGSETILVVEDETSLRRLLCMSLERRGYKVFAAKDGAEAIEIFRQHGGQIHAVVSDIMMPRVDGFDLKQRIAALRPDVKFLLMSGYSEEIVGQQPTLLQGCAFLEKPFLPDELVDKVRDLLKGEAAA